MHITDYIKFKFFSKTKKSLYAYDDGGLVGPLSHQQLFELSIEKGNSGNILFSAKSFKGWYRIGELSLKNKSRYFFLRLSHVFLKPYSLVGHPARKQKATSDYPRSVVNTIALRKYKHTVLCLLSCGLYTFFWYRHMISIFLSRHTLRLDERLKIYFLAIMACIPLFSRRPLKILCKVISLSGQVSYLERDSRFIYTIPFLGIWYIERSLELMVLRQMVQKNS